MLKYVGDYSQLFGIKEYTLSGGKAKGIKAFDVQNGSGLEYPVLSDRCLYIAGVSFKGTNSGSMIGYKILPEKNIVAMFEAVNEFNK